MTTENQIKEKKYKIQKEIERFCLNAWKPKKDLLISWVTYITHQIEDKRSIRDEDKKHTKDIQVILSNIHDHFFDYFSTGRDVEAKLNQLGMEESAKAIFKFDQEVKELLRDIDKILNQI